MKILVRGPYSQSGFGVACIGLIKVLLNAGHDVQFIPLNTNPGQHKIGFSQELATLIDSLVVDEDAKKHTEVGIDVGSLIYGLSVPPLEVDKNILYCTTETTDIHEDYVAMMNEKYDEIWTATNFNKIGFMSSGVSNTIKVLPHVIDTDHFNPEALPLNIANKREFNFVANFDLSYRKGLHLLLPAYTEVFDADDDVALILKITNNNFKDRNAAVQKLNELFFMMDINSKKHAPILFMFDMLPDNYLPGLYTTGDVYVAPNLGEGFALPIAEAMACGIPPIVTRCGGPLDYVNSKSGFLVSLDKEKSTIPIQDQSLLQRDPRYRGRSIFNIDIESLKEKLKDAHLNATETKEKGLKARERVLSKLSLEAVTKKLEKILC